MRAEGETKTTNPINIVQARVERSVLCLAIGQVTLNLTVTINRRATSTGRVRRYVPKLLAVAMLAGVAWPGFAAAPGWGIERLKTDGSWSQVFKHSDVGTARTQALTFCDPEMAKRMQWSPPMSVRVTFYPESGMPEPVVAVLSCAAVQANPDLVKTFIPEPKRPSPKIKETVNLWD